MGSLNAGRRARALREKLVGNHRQCPCSFSTPLFPRDTQVGKHVCRTRTHYAVQGVQCRTKGVEVGGDEQRREIVLSVDLAIRPWPIYAGNRMGQGSMESLDKGNVCHSTKERPGGGRATRSHPVHRFSLVKTFRVVYASICTQVMMR